MVMYFTFLQTKEENGKYFFQCQHGEEECYANRIHACAIEAVANMTTSVKITECMINDNMDADGALARVNITYIFALYQFTEINLLNISSI